MSFFSASAYLLLRPHRWLTCCFALGLGLWTIIASSLSLQRVGVLLYALLRLTYSLLIACALALRCVLASHFHTYYCAVPQVPDIFCCVGSRALDHRCFLIELVVRECFKVCMAKIYTLVVNGLWFGIAMCACFRPSCLLLCSNNRG